jgi:hypothetical protein
MSRTIRRVSVYCGSRKGDDGVFVTAARELGHTLASRDIGVVFGGGHVGLMGVLADAVLEARGTIIGVIPEKLLDLELGHERVTRLEVVPDLHARKHRMASLADAFIALPGGFGTLEELFEVTTWTQLAYHDKPVGVLNVAGYYDPLVHMVRNAVERGFIREIHKDLMLFDDDAARLLDRMAQSEHPPVGEWVRDS